MKRFLISAVTLLGLTLVIVCVAKKESSDPRNLNPIPTPAKILRDHATPTPTPANTGPRYQPNEPTPILRPKVTPTPSPSA